MEYWVELLQTFGFAAICCGAMAYFVKYMFDKYESRLSSQRDEFLATINSITAKHAEEAAEQRAVTQKLSDSIDKLAERMQAWEDKT